jgi:glycosyltransferase involved in cell wall biosynthesis
MSSPVVTVLMPVYNAQDFLREAVDSVLSQSFTDFELLAIDDGSTDGSALMLSSYSDHRIRVLSNERNIGLIGTLNRGIGEARGRYIIRQDADDISLPGRFAQLVAHMEAHPDVAICGSWYDGLTDGVRHPGVRYAPDDATIRLRHLYQIHISHGTSIWRTEAFRGHGWLFDPDFRHAEDYDLFVRASLSARLANLPEVLYLVRYHGASVSQVHSAVQDTNSVRVIMRLFGHLGAPATPAHVAAFRAMCYGEYSSNSIDLGQLGILLGTLAQSQSAADYVSRTELLAFLAHRWYHLCYHRRAYSVWRSNPLARHATQEGIFSRVKFRVRSLFNV